MSPRKMMSQAEYIMPYAKTVIKQQLETRDGKVILDIRYVADKFSADLTDALYMLHLLEDQGYCFTPMGDFKYRYVGMATERSLSSDEQAEHLFVVIRDLYLNQVRQLTREVSDEILRHDLERLGNLLSHR